MTIDRMQRTVRLKLHVSEDDKEILLKTMEAYTLAFNISAKWGFENKKFNKMANHEATYRPTRDAVPELPSSLLQGARDCAYEALKAIKCKNMPKRYPHSAMRYNQRVARVCIENGYATLASVEKRIRVEFKFPEHFERYVKWDIKTSNLIYDRGSRTFYLSVTVEHPDIPRVEEEIVLGIDRGIKNIAVTSDNRFFDSKEINRVRGRYKHLRAELQSKGTSSAKRKLKKLAGKERRFMTDVNHRVSKQIAESEHTIFALEDLKKVRNQRRKGAKLNGMLNSWAFYQFEQFLTYKAEALGKRVVKVDARYTSQKCSKCEYIDKKSRSGSRFKCVSCGFELHADLNASRNIARLGISDSSRLSVNQPNVTSNDSYKLPDLSGSS